jgi:hypothetical protein
MVDEQPPGKIPAPAENAILKLAVTLGGYVSFAYALGYIYWWSYLDVFGAAFLISQVPTIEALFGSATTLAPLATFMGGFFLERKVHLPTIPLKNIAAGFGLLGLIIFFIDMKFGRGFLDIVRCRAYFVAGVATMLGATAWAELAIGAWRNHERRPLLKRAGAFVIYAFVLWPCFAGLNRGFRDIALAEIELPLLSTKTGAKAYVLFATSDRIYCVSKLRTPSPPTVVITSWDSVQSITGVSELEIDKDRK